MGQMCPVCFVDADGLAARDAADRAWELEAAKRWPHIYGHARSKDPLVIRQHLPRVDQCDRWFCSDFCQQKFNGG